MRIRHYIFAKLRNARSFDKPCGFLGILPFKGCKSANYGASYYETVGKLHETMIIKIDKNNPRGKYIASLPYARVEGKDLQKAIQEALRLFMIINIEELKQRLCLINPKTGKDKYPIYGLFKDKVLEVAISLVSEEDELRGMSKTAWEIPRAS